VSAGTRDADHTAQLNDTVRVALGDKVRFPQAGVVLQFDSVLADSRCARGVMCVWAGSVRARLSVDSSNARRTVDLESNTDPRSTKIGTYEIRLLPEVEPVKGDTGRYVIWLAVTTS
jgi:hypothetical protein